MFIWFLLSSFSVLGQDRVVYNEDFQFENGIYLTFQDFKNNNPIRPEYILSDLDIRNPNYLDRIVENDTIPTTTIFMKRGRFWQMRCGVRKEWIGSH
jgi:hypothetical protein